MGADVKGPFPKPDRRQLRELDLLGYDGPKPADMDEAMNLIGLLRGEKALKASIENPEAFGLPDNELDASFLRGLAARGCRFTICPPKDHTYTKKDGSTTVYTGKSPQGLAWAKEGGANYALTDSDLIEAKKKGWNMGLVCGTGGVVPFDADALTRLEELGVIAKLPATVEIESRPDHRHRYYICHKLKKKFPFYDPMETEVDPKSGKLRRVHLGEVLGPGGHVVLPGSIHPEAGTTYHVVSGGPEEMTELSLGDLRDICQGLEFARPLSVSKSFNEAAGLTTRATKAPQQARGNSLSGQIGDIRRVLKAYEWEDVRRSGDEWYGPPPNHSSDSGDCFQINIKKNVWHCKSCDVGGDIASLIAMFEGLITCEKAIQISRDKALFKKVLKAAQAKGLVEGPEERGLDEALEEVKGLLDRARDDPGAPFDNLDALATIRDKAPSEWARIRAKLKGNKKISIGELDRLTTKKLNERKEAESRRKAEAVRQRAEAEATEDIPEADPEIIAEARDILENGDPVGFAMGVFSSLHMGDESAGKLVYCCQLTPHILNSKGLHPKASGDSGKGKSDLFEAVLHTLPAEWWLKASLSSKALFYNDIKPGTVIFCDDYQQNDDIDTIIKQATSRFHQPYYHLTVDRAKGGLVGRKLPIPEALVWAITSIDPDQDIQVLNRAVPLDVDDSFEADKAVADHVLEQAITGGDDLPETREVLVCRELFRILKSESVRVKIPFADRIIWRDPTNRRNLPMFLDILRSLTFWRRFQREVVDDYLLATEEDFEDAKVLYCGEQRSDTFKTKLSARERELAELIVEHGGELSRQEAATLLGVTPNRIDQLTRGKGKSGDRRGGLSDKLAGFNIEYSNDTKWGAAPTGSSKTIKSTVFKLKSFDVWGDVESVVSLSHAAAAGRNHGTPTEPPKEPPNGTPITTHKRERESIREPLRGVSERAREKENNSPTSASSVEKGFLFSFPSLPLKTKKGVPLGGNAPTDSERRGSVRGSVGFRWGSDTSPDKGSFGFQGDLLSEEHFAQLDQEPPEDEGDLRAARAGAEFYDLIEEEIGVV